MELALDLTHEYTLSRNAFGKPIFAFQNTKFMLAEVATEARVGRSFVDECIELHVKGGLDIQTAAMAKLRTSERAQKCVDKCLQLHGRYGYMNECPIACAWADLRVSQIYAGTSEIKGDHRAHDADPLGGGRSNPVPRALRMSDACPRQGWASVIEREGPIP